MKAYVAVVAGLLVLSGCGQTGAGGLVDSGARSPAGSGAIPFSERLPLPELAGRPLQGDSLTTTNYIGEIVVINLWGSWCGPCRSEAPILRDLANRTKNQGVRFLGLNTRDKADAAQAFERAFAMPYPSLVDDGGQLTARTNGIVPINAIPSTIVVDRDGYVAGTVVGETTFSQLQQLISAADPTRKPPSSGPTMTTPTRTKETP